MNSYYFSTLFQIATLLKGVLQNKVLPFLYTTLLIFYTTGYLKLLVYSLNYHYALTTFSFLLFFLFFKLFSIKYNTGIKISVINVERASPKITVIPNGF